MRPAPISRTDHHDDRDDRERDDRRDHRRLRLVELRDLHLRAEVRVVRAGEAIALEILAPERFDDALVGQHFGQIAREVGDAFLRRARADA